MNIELKKLSAGDGIDIYEMLQEIPKDDNGFTNRVNGMNYDAYKQRLIWNENFSKTTEVEDGWKVPSTTYWLFVDDKPVGTGRIRHFLTDMLREEGGHIGYAIRPDERNKGYGTILLKKLLAEAKQMNIDKVLITMRNDNVYSLKVALANNGVIERKNEFRYFVWIECKI